MATYPALLTTTAGVHKSSVAHQKVALQAKLCEAPDLSKQCCLMMTDNRGLLNQQNSEWF